MVLGSTAAPAMSIARVLHSVVPPVPPTRQALAAASRFVRGSGAVDCPTVVVDLDETVLYRKYVAWDAGLAKARAVAFGVLLCVGDRLLTTDHAGFAELLCAGILTHGSRPLVCCGASPSHRSVLDNLRLYAWPSNNAGVPHDAVAESLRAISSHFRVVRP